MEALYALAGLGSGLGATYTVPTTPVHLGYAGEDKLAIYGYEGNGKYVIDGETFYTSFNVYKRNIKINSRMTSRDWEDVANLQAIQADAINAMIAEQDKRIVALEKKRMEAATPPPPPEPTPTPVPAPTPAPVVIPPTAIRRGRLVGTTSETGGGIPPGPPDVTPTPPSGFFITPTGTFEPTAAGQAAADRAAAEAYRKAVFLIGQPGYDYGIGSNRRNAFFNEGREPMSGLGASFDFVEALTTAAKQTAQGYKGSEVLARAGIRLPNVPAPLLTFVNRAADALKKQRAAKAPPADTVPTGGSVYFPPASTQATPWGTYALYAALGYGGYLLIKRLSR